MECVSWSNGVLQTGEDVAHEQNMVTVYNNEEKTGFQRGKLRLTNYRLLWHDSNDYRCIIELHLSQIVSVELRSAGSAQVSRPGASSRDVYSRIVLALQRSLTGYNYVCEMPAGYQTSGRASLVQFEFEYGGHNEFLQQLNQQIGAQSWTYSGSKPSSGLSSPHTIGIAGIQRKIQDRLDLQDQKINDSFKVLTSF